jgi:hypothetical protein
MQVQDEFYTCVKVPEVATKLQLDEETVDVIFQYWKLKRKVMSRILRFGGQIIDLLLPRVSARNEF